MPINRIAPKKSKIEHNEGPQREQNEGPQTKERKCIWLTLKLKYKNSFPLDLKVSGLLLLSVVGPGSIKLR